MYLIALRILSTTEPVVMLMFIFIFLRNTAIHSVTVPRGQLLPMLAPDLWKRAVRFISRFPSEKIRYIGLESVVLGLVLVWAGSLLF